ncbi:hypothetical protein MNQ98_24520 [Paenibacillus sp. N3/727]|uniref:hypothetical protein n=1 Tax=Paenibacillus sp. N3/727 TaxID=2925845 RepID=UPI001F53CC05|nr:hypothetical protein [Paenibacillus sp. N3/727]UNK17588.1 hypothetical protein MNQ98_24520 [Paenibacillus sp. N3/727]
MPRDCRFPRNGGWTNSSFYHDILEISNSFDFQNKQWKGEKIYAPVICCIHAAVRVILAFFYGYNLSWENRHVVLNFGLSYSLIVLI